MFHGTDILEFIKAFDKNEKCLEYLSVSKWKKGFKCVKCKNETFSNTNMPFVRKCNRCKHKESATAGTLFHKCKFDLQKAFMIVFLVSTGKKGISSTELSRKLSLRQKTCYTFKRKVMEAMKSSGYIKLQGKVDVDEFFSGGYEKGKPGRSSGNKKQVVLGVELKNKSIYRCTAQVINNGGAKELRPFFEKHIDKKANVRTDKWRGYTSLKDEYKELKQEKSKPGSNFKLLHRQVMMIKAWLRGIHHSVKNLQPYLDEFCYRFNRCNAGDRIFNNLIVRMIYHKPVYIKNLKMG